MKHRAWLAAGLLALPIGCGGPPPRVYVLDTAAGAQPAIAAADTRPAVELTRVTIPDYLDTTDISSRDGGNGISISRTGQWGERLSVGTARALSATLARIAPSLRIVRTSLSARDARILSVELEAFEPRADGQCVLVAHWTILSGDRRTILASGRGTFVSRIQGRSGDAAVVAAMADTVTQLAGPIAAALTQTSR